MQSKKDCSNRIEVKEMLVKNLWSQNIEKPAQHSCSFNCDYTRAFEIQDWLSSERGIL